MKPRTAICVISLGLLLLLSPLAAGAVTLPSASYTISGIAGTNGWYRGSADGNYVVVHWAVSDPDQLVLRTEGCEAAVPVAGPTTGTRLTCTVYLKNGGFIPFPTGLIKIDAAPPTNVALRVARSPDHNGWYNHPLGVSWSGRDATSGIASCSNVTYSGPGGAGVVVHGGCIDGAGNITAKDVAINYDATPPTVSNVSVDSTADADVVRWASSSSTDAILVRRAARGNKGHVTVFRGTGWRFVDRRILPGIEYRYEIRSFDQAGNGSTEVPIAGLPKVLTLRPTPYVPRAAPKPILRWPRTRGARYYHVQLFRGAKRVLAAWPETHQFGLPKAWRWGSHRYRLGPGRYRWYVWAGLGVRTLARYKTVGSAAFVVPQR